MYGVKKIGSINAKAAKQIKNSRFGIGLEKLDRNLFDPTSCYDPISEIGAKWCRIQSGWARTEKVRGQYDFEWLDSIVDNIVKRGMLPWMCLCYGNEVYTPGANNKAGAVGRPPIFTDDEKEGWSNYVTACVKHFANRVDYFEIWNEPDGPWCWRHGPNAKEYGQFAIDTSLAIKKADENVKIIGGSVCMGTSFLYSFLETGAGKYLDYITYHNYKFDVESGVEDLVGALRQVINLFNPSIKLIQGETGAQSRYSTQGALNRADWTQRKQAKHLMRKMMIDMKTEVVFSSYFSSVDIFENISNDEGTVTEDYYGFFGVLGEMFDDSGKPLGKYFKKDAYRSFQVICSLLSDDTEVCELPVYFRSDESTLNGGRDVNAHNHINNVYSVCFKKSNGSSALVYWKAEDILTTDLTSTISVSCYGLGNDMKFIDMYDGSVFEFEDKMIEQNGGENKLMNIPIKDYPVMITFGDFADYGNEIK